MPGNRLSDRGFTSTRGLSYTLEDTATNVDGAFPASHGLGAVPSSLELWVEQGTPGSGEWEKHDAGTYLVATATSLVAGASALAATNGGPFPDNTNIRIVAAAGAVALSVAEASASQAGIVSTGTQTIAGAKTFSSTLRVQQGTQSAIFGADAGLTTLTDATNKLGSLAVPHYTNAEEPLALISGQSSSAINYVDIGGGNSQRNAATDIRLFTAATTTTTTGTERMRIDSSGNVGIGTPSPSGGVSGSERVLHIADAEAPVLTLEATAGTDPTKWSIYSASSNGRLEFFNATDTVQAMGISPTGAVTLGPSGGAPMHQAFGNSDAVFQFRNTANFLRADGIKISLANSNAGGGALGSTAFLRCFNDAAGTTENNNERMVIRTDGSVYNATNNYGSTSDIALKTEVETARNYLSDLCLLRPVTYKRIDAIEKKQLGLIAQEVEQVFPGLVEGEEGSKSVKYSIINIMMLKSIQELSAKLDAQQAEIELLKGAN